MALSSKLKAGDSVRVFDSDSEVPFYNAVVDTIGRKYIYVSSVGFNSTKERFDVKTHRYVDKNGNLSADKYLL